MIADFFNSDKTGRIRDFCSSMLLLPFLSKICQYNGSARWHHITLITKIFLSRHCVRSITNLRVWVWGIFAFNFFWSRGIYSLSMLRVDNFKNLCTLRLLLSNWKGFGIKVASNSMLTCFWDCQRYTKILRVRYSVLFSCRCRWRR